MDYASFFPAASNPYAFIGLPPTPSHDDGKHGELGPVDALDPSFISPYDVFTSFNPSALFQTDLAGSPPAANSPPLVIGSMDSGFGGESMEASVGRTRSSSEEKENLTPAQSRRKAQNRAAQRAFRERKERHVKDLEAKLSALESSASTLQSDNARLKQALQRAKTENELLRASSGTLGAAPSLGPDTGPTAAPARPSGLPPSATNPLYLSSSSAARLRRHSDAPAPLRAAAAWDLIQSHPLVRQGLVDMGDVCERLRPLATCDGRGGPMFREVDVRAAVEGCRRCGGDQLI